MKIVAIYSRKSKFTGKGESIENQVQMCKDYINKSIKEKVEFIVYEDEGFSGGNLDRPEFKKLMSNIKNIDILICYRLDRISRNVADFSSTLEILQQNNCSFISVSEQFDTSNPMGRAMIYIASVFAQLERETIAERVKDNMLEMAKNGLWTGGKIPVGFKSIKTKYIDENGNTKSRPKLIKNDKEAEFVKLLYKKYLELGSLHKLECYISENNIRSKNNILYEKSTLKIILQNPIYVKANNEVIDYLKDNDWNVYGQADNIHSLLTYNKTEQTKKNGKYVKQNKDISERLAAISSIEGFIDPQLWLDVQRQFDNNRDTFPRLGKTHNALLVGKLRCGNCKEYMLVQHGKISKITGKKAFYYVCSLKRKSHKKLCDNKNIKADKIEKLVILGLKGLYVSREAYLRELEKLYNSNKSNDNLNDDILVLQKSIETKKKQIDSLLDKLSLSNDPDLTSLILNKIQKIKNECNSAEQKINEFNNKIKQNKIESFNLNIIKHALKNCEQIDKLSPNKQKELIDLLIDTIYYYGPSDDSPKGKITIKFMGGIDLKSFSEIYPEMLHFCSPSTCNVNKNATFRKVFKDLNVCDDLYKLLPENTLAEKIKKLRKATGLTQREFAKKCNIGYTSLCKYECGYNISRLNKQKICAACEVDTNYLE